MSAISKRSRQARYRYGVMAEWAALLWLMMKGYWPIAWRAKTPVGEIDLIVRRGRTLAVVEVKARANFDRAAEAVHSKNQQRVVRAAQYYLASRPTLAQCEVRFDVCLVAWYRWPQHTANAFDASYSS